MKRTWIALLLAAVVLTALIGCSSPQQKAQKMIAAGQYEQVIALYQNDPNMASFVTEAKNKIAEKLLADGKFSSVIELYPDSPAAKEARNKIAEGLLAEKKYQEILDKYADTPAAPAAKLALENEKMQNDAAQNAGNEKERVAKANAELKRIMAIKIKDLRQKALKEFVANPLYKGTPALDKARAAIK